MPATITCRSCGHVNDVASSHGREKNTCGGCGEALAGSTAGVPDGGPAVVKFVCPACGRKYSTKAEMAGKKIRCNGCGGGVRVPAPDGAGTGRPAMKSFGDSDGASRPPTVRSREPVPSAASKSEPAAADESSLLDDLATLEGTKRSKRAEAVLPSRAVVMEQVRQKAAEQQAVEAEKQEKKAKKKKKRKKKGSDFFDPKDVMSLVGGVGAFVVVLAFLAWGYPDLRFPVGGFLCLVGFIVYMVGAFSIRQVVAEEGFHHVILFRFFWPYQLYFVATRWAETKDFVAFFAAGVVILSLGGSVIMTSPIGKKAQESEKAYQKAAKGNPGVAPVPVSDVADDDEN